jgi:hypothetical protein
MIAADRLAAARANDCLLYIELYCTGEECPVREVHVRVKDFHGELQDMVHARGGMACPVCGEPTKLHWAQTAEQRRLEDEADARMSVNIQMHRRDHAADRFRGVTLRDMTDDRLPPTPSNWWARPEDVA